MCGPALTDVLSGFTNCSIYHNTVSLVVGVFLCAFTRRKNVLELFVIHVFFFFFFFVFFFNLFVSSRICSLLRHLLASLILAYIVFIFSFARCAHFLPLKTLKMAPLYSTENFLCPRSMSFLLEFGSMSVIWNTMFRC